jgi:hypothetical protein
MMMKNICKKLYLTFPLSKCNYSVLCCQLNKNAAKLILRKVRIASDILPLHIYTERSYTGASSIRPKFFLMLFTLFMSHFSLDYDYSM